MNKTKIEWCDYTWNPVTGCLYNCEWCYAQRIARRFAPKEVVGCDDCTQPPNGLHEIRYKNSGSIWRYGFAPTLHSYRLGEPKYTKKTQNIFVCSMADLYGNWVPDEWISEVFKACEAAPQHNYLFLTKNSVRYELYHNKYQNKLGESFIKRNNVWVGATRTADEKISHLARFVSLEPIQVEINVENLRFFELVIVGAETGKRKGKTVPEKDWIEKIAKFCSQRNIPLFMKNSLKKIWGEDLIREFPTELIKERNAKNALAEEQENE